MSLHFQDFPEEEWAIKMVSGLLDLCRQHPKYASVVHPRQWHNSPATRPRENVNKAKIPNGKISQRSGCFLYCKEWQKRWSQKSMLASASGRFILSSKNSIVAAASSPWATLFLQRHCTPLLTPSLCHRNLAQFARPPLICLPGEDTVGGHPDKMSASEGGGGHWKADVVSEVVGIS